MRSIPVFIRLIKKLFKFIYGRNRNENIITGCKKITCIVSFTQFTKIQIKYVSPYIIFSQWFFLQLNK